MGKSQNVGIKSAFMPIKYMGGSGLGLASLEFYDPNPTRPAIKKIFVTQPNPPSLKNRSNLTGWVESGRI